MSRRITTGRLINLLTFFAQRTKLKHNGWIKAGSADPVLNGHLRYPNNLDQSLNDTTTDKLRKYLTDYNFNPTRGVGFIPAIASTSGRLHSEFIRNLFLHVHRETEVKPEMS